MKAVCLLFLVIIPGHFMISFRNSDCKIKSFISHFSKTHKNWTQDDNTTKEINIVFADSLQLFYNREAHAIDHLMIRPESVLEKGNGKRQVSWETYRNFADGKEIKAHIYSNSEERLINKISMGQDYFLYGKIISSDIHDGIGYNKTDNTCDVGILEIEIDSIQNLRNKTIFK